MKANLQTPSDVKKMMPLFKTTLSLLSIHILLTINSLAQKEPLTVTTSIRADELVEYDMTPQSIQTLINHCLELAGMGLFYQYGSADPNKGGLDCSGTIHHLLKDRMSLKNVPRQANYFYRWVWQSSEFHAVNSSQSQGFEWSKLKPGDLLFWSGTYDVKRDPPVTHVMIYLGTLKKDGRRVMFGASSGRRFENRPQHGVSVFDLHLPKPTSKSRFLGYGSIPGFKIESKISQVEPPSKGAN
ncbi:MAG: NlpC/P60 family protein [Verrucomicrobiota bacterium]